MIMNQPLDRVVVRYYMKRILIVSMLAFLSCSLSAQKRVDAFMLIDDVCKDELSMSQLREKYWDYVLPDRSGFNPDSSAQYMTLCNVDLAGYVSEAYFFVMGDRKLLTISPNRGEIDSVSMVGASDKCYKQMILRYGNPDEEGECADSPIVQQFVDEGLLRNGKSYTWDNFSENVLGNYGSSISFNVGESGVWSVMAFVRKFPYQTRVPIQRQFFRSLKLGAYVDQQQIASAIGVDSYKIGEERGVSGKDYRYWDSIYFGGVKWSFAEFCGVGGRLALVKLTDSQIDDNSQIFDSLKKSLTNKYGSPASDDGDCLVWHDGTTMLVLSRSYSASRAGEMRHYVDINYADARLLKKSEEIVSDEL